MKSAINMNKTFRILELIWLFIACIAILLCAFSILSGDTRGAVYFIVLTFAAGLMYAVRRKQRIKYEAQKKKEEPQKK